MLARRGTFADLRNVVIALVLLLALVLPASADEPATMSAPDRADIQAVIAGQIEAFRHDDADAAFAAAAPNIQSRFGTPDRFLGVVRQLYQPVYRPRAFSFGDVVTDGGELIQKVDIVGPDGVHQTARYSMVKLPDGTWHIAGCELVESENHDT
jgi:hypothetical protein